MDPIFLGAVALAALWSGTYAGAKSKPEEKRQRAPHRTANNVTTFAVAALSVTESLGNAVDATGKGIAGGINEGSKKAAESLLKK